MRKLAFFFCLLGWLPLVLRADLKKVYITPGFSVQLFAIDSPLFNRDGGIEVFYQLREEARKAGYELIQADSLENLEDFEYLVVFDVFLDQLPAIAKYPKEKLILFLWEPPSVIPENFNLNHHRFFSKVYTWHEGLVDGKKYFKFHYPVMKEMVPKTVPFSERMLCTLIACNKGSSYPGELYSERLKLVYFFENLGGDDFVLLGKWWPPYLKTYGGPIEHKVDYLKFFRFCFAYENIRGLPGYITEKIFDCFHAGVVPVYWGAPDIESVIPEGCFIDRRDFLTQEKLYQFLKQMSGAEHERYLRNIRAFLNSSEAQRFTKKGFIQLFIEMLQTPNRGIGN